MGKTGSNGYSVNDKGQTYGPNIKDSTEEPDLILVQCGDGVAGYVKKEDFDGPNHKTPEEALSYQAQVQGRYIDVYLSDGETKIGEFYIG